MVGSCLSEANARHNGVASFVFSCAARAEYPAHHCLLSTHRIDDFVAAEHFSALRARQPEEAEYGGVEFVQPAHEPILMQVTIERHTDAKHLNSIVNHADVYPWVRGPIEGPLDFSEAVSSDNVIALLGEHGGQVYHRLMPALFEAHSQFTPKGRGEWALEATRLSLHWMFTRTEAAEIVTRCPHGNPAAKALAKVVGGTFEFVRPNGWVMNGKPVPADMFSLKIEDWMRSASGLVEKCRWFHDRLKAEFDRHGATEPQHADDEVHDRYVGAACEMFLGGQALKGAALYNRWAVMAGYHPVWIASLDPVTVDIGTALVVVNGDDFIVPSLKQSTQH